MYNQTSKPILFLNQYELSQRWKVSGRTLERWRYNGMGPAFLKVGGRVLYRLAEIERFEALGEVNWQSEEITNA